jgi:adenylate kinase
MRAVLVGPPGAGKGTQATVIAQRFEVPAISTGDIFRANVGEGTALGREAQGFMDSGNLVPDELTIAMVRDRLSRPDAKAGFLLDGFPRNVAQARVLDSMLTELDTSLDVVLELAVDGEEVVRRLSGRRTCAGCGRLWHVDFHPTAVAGVCDVCGGELTQREDDQPETIRHRLTVYAEQTEPIIAYYADRGLLERIDAVGPLEEVTARAVGALDARFG